MNGRVKKMLIWVSVTLLLFLGFRFLLRLFGGFHYFGSNPQTFYISRGPGHGPGFGAHHHMMHGPHHAWIGMLLFLLAVFLIGRFLFKKFLKSNSNNSFNQFVNEPSLPALNAPVNRRNADVLDNWERNLNVNTKKENE